MNFIKGINLTVIFLILAIFSFGELAIFTQNDQLAFQQFLFFLFGLAIFFLISSFDIRIFKPLAFTIWTVCLILVFFVTFTAPEIRGSSRWIDVGFFRFQPTELAKPALILALAQVFEKSQINFIKNFLKSLGFVAPFILLSFFQPDLGNSIIFLLIWYLGLFIAGYNWKILLGVVVLSLLFLPVSFFSLAPYQRLRLETFINPAGDPLGAGYSVIQSQIAVGSGRIFGRGLAGASQSRLEFLPESPTDFIFASIAESMGFVGSVVFVGLFLSLIYLLVKGSNVSDRFSQILILLSVGLLLFQFVINLAMSIGLLPVVGVTLPFVSYGGSSLVSSFILLGLIQSQLRFVSKTN